MNLSDIVPPAQWRLLVESDQDGDSELAEQITGLKRGEQAAWLELFRRAAQMGPEKLPSGNRHRVDDNNDIWEFIKGNFRVLYFYDEGKVVVCSHIFRKKSQKTPNKEKAKATRLRDRYFSEKQSGNLTITE